MSPAARRKSESTPSASSGEDELASRRSVVQSVDRAFAVLHVLQNAPGPLSVQETALRAGLDRTVVHRLLKTLVQHSMAVEEQGTFGLGPESVALANRYIDALAVRRLALPHLVEIQTRDIADSPWTATLSIPVGDISAVIERVWTPTTPLDVVLNSAEALPIDLTATGRSILAFYEPQRLVDIIGKKRAETLQPILDATREAGGVGLSRGEAVPGVDAVASVILSRRSVPVASLGVSGVQLGDELAYDSRLATKLRRATHAIGAMIP
jgi:DNA-binding IclR family transcriptional regulator